MRKLALLTAAFLLVAERDAEIAALRKRVRR